jgi:hypothetical protein
MDVSARHLLPAVLFWMLIWLHMISASWTMPKVCSIAAL